MYKKKSKHLKKKKGHHRDDIKNVIASSEIELSALKRTPNGMTVI